MFPDARLDDLEQVLRLYRQLQPGDAPLADGSAKAIYDQILLTSSNSQDLWFGVLRDQLLTS